MSDVERPDLRDTLRHYLRSRGLPDPITPHAVLAGMCGFYRDVRVDGCDAITGHDNLIVQWGTYDWRDGSGRHFEFDVTRQLVADTQEDEDIWHLSVTLRFPPEDSLIALGKGERWCMYLGEADWFEASVKALPAYAVVADRPGEPRILWECAG